MSVQPKGEKIKNAIKWISEEKKADPELNPINLADKAAIRFDLSPKDTDFLYRFVKEGKELENK